MEFHFKHGELNFHFKPRELKYYEGIGYVTKSNPEYALYVCMHYKTFHKKSGKRVMAKHTAKFSQWVCASNTNSLGIDKSDEEIKAELKCESKAWIENMKINFPFAKFKYV